MCWKEHNGTQFGKNLSRTNAVFRLQAKYSQPCLEAHLYSQSLSIKAA